MKKFHINILFLLIWNFLFSQQYINYNTKNGLPSNHVYRITQDYQGFIWLLTDKGIVKYNGTNFKTFTTKEGLPSNDVWDIRIGHDNKIWFFTKASKLGYIENDSVYTFESEQKNEILFPRTINQNKNEIFFSNSKKDYFLKNNFWKSETTNSLDYPEKISHAKISTILVRNKRDSMLVFNKNKVCIKSYKLNKKFFSNRYRGQINDSLFCWINDDAIFFLNLNTLKLIESNYSFKPKKFIRFSAVNNSIQFSGENFVSFLDTNYQLNNVINIPKQLNSHFSFIDKNNNLWIATFANGVYFLPASKREANYSIQNEKVSRIQKVNNDIIANVYKKGFYKYDTILNKFKPYLKIDDFIFSAKYLKELNTSYYITNHKVLQLKNGKKTNIDNLDISKSLVYHNSFLYSNTSFGLNKINPENYKVEKTISQNGIRNIIKFKDKIFLASANGIKQLNKDSIIPIKINDNEFNKPIVSFSIYNKNDLIICTEGFGAYITNLEEIELLEQSDFLNIQSAFVKNDEIWLATNKGVWRYKKQKNTFKLIKKYTINEGLSLNQINDIFVLDDKILASSNYGVSIIPINQTTKNQFVNLYFESITFNGKFIINNNVSYTDNNQLQVKVESINFSENADFYYEYQLLPTQKKWITTSSSQISFNNLPPNKYTLNIKSNDKNNTVTFKIKPLWYQTIFAKIVFGLFFLTFLIGIVYLIKKRELDKQSKKLNAQKKLADFELRALRSQMNPHFVFNSLNAIQYFITKNEIDLSEKYLVKFARLIRMFFDFSRKKEITLQEEINLLKGYLEIEKMRFGDNFNFKFNVDEKLFLSNFKIPTMLLQPIVENAVNHGIFHNNGKGLIELSFIFIDKHHYKISIVDDGVGIKKSKEIQQQSLKKHDSKSTEILNDRIELLNQSKLWHITYQIIDNNGTTVQLSITKNE